MEKKSTNIITVCYSDIDAMGYTSTSKFIEIADNHTYEALSDFGYNISLLNKNKLILNTTKVIVELKRKTGLDDILTINSTVNKINNRIKTECFILVDQEDNVHVVIEYELNKKI